MAYMSETDYQKLAQAAAVDLVDGNISLNDSVTKLAKQFDLNQDQICRLCEATNNAAFNSIFQKKASNSDRLVDFDIADPKKILGQQIKEASVTVNDNAPAAVTELLELPDLRHIGTRDLLKTAEGEDAVRVRVIGKGGDLQIFSVGKQYWEMPSGVLQKNESRQSAAARILLSQTGLRAMPTQLKYSGLQSFRGKMYHTFEADVDNLTRANMPPADAKGNKPRIEYRKEAGFELRPESKQDSEPDIRALEKTEEYLRHEKIAAVQAYHDTLSKLAQEFRRLYAPQTFEAFEKQAAALWQEAAEEHLSALRAVLKKTAVAYNYPALIKAAGYINTDPPQFKLFSELLDQHTKIAKCDAAMKLIRKKTTKMQSAMRAS